MYSGSTNDCLAWDVCSASKIVEHDDLEMKHLFVQITFGPFILGVDLVLGKMHLTFTCLICINASSAHLHC
jgi:hypothetical protein